MSKTFPFYKQPDSKDCSPTCLRIIAKHYGRRISLKEICEIIKTTRSGSSLLKLSQAAEGRRKLLVAHSGRTIVEVNNLMKQFGDMRKMMKQMNKMGGAKAALGKMMPGMGKR
jgi:signal recognition particle GTPase